jgi:transcriptional regulator with XRE-family HTH domain
MSQAQVVSLAERLRRRREELGLSQAQAARELDVARTAYRLWELEAAQPQPDRWRLISRWLGVSVATMLLSDDADEIAPESADLAFDRVGRDWDRPLRDPDDFFASARNLVQEGAEQGFMTTDHAQDLLALFGRIEEDQSGDASEEWQPTRLEKALVANKKAPKAARDAVAFVAGDLEADSLRDAQLLISELVTNSVTHGTPRRGRKVAILIDVNRTRLRVDVTDSGTDAPQLKAGQDDAGFGLRIVEELAGRWGTSRVPGGNVTWFDLDITSPGAMPARQ